MQSPVNTLSSENPPKVFFHLNALENFIATHVA